MPRKTSPLPETPKRPRAPRKPRVAAAAPEPVAVIERRRPAGPSPIIAIIAVLVVVGGLGWVGYWTYQHFVDADNEHLRDEQVGQYQIPLGIPVDQPTEPAPNPMANWSQYQDSNHFTFSYPPDFKLGTSTKQGARTAYVLTSSTTPDVRLRLTVASTSKSLAQYVGELDALASTAWEGKPAIAVINSQPAQVASRAAIVRQESLLAAGEQALTSYISVSSSTIAILSLEASQIREGEQSLYQQMLNSFAIVPPAAPTATTTMATTTATTTTTSTSTKR